MVSELVNAILEYASVRYQHDTSSPISHSVLVSRDTRHPPLRDHRALET